MNFTKGLKGLAFGLLVVFATLTTSVADGWLGCPVTLAWDASPDVNVTGYALYYGWENPAVTNRLDVGPLQSVVLTNLYAYSNHFFFVVAYNALGIESVPSGLVYYSPPAITKLRIAKLPEGSTVLRFRSAAGLQCRVEYSTTPHSGPWQLLAVTNADAGGNVVIHDSAIGVPAGRFYRAVRP